MGWRQNVYSKQIETPLEQGKTIEPVVEPLGISRLRLLHKLNRYTTYYITRARGRGQDKNTGIDSHSAFRQHQRRIDYKLPQGSTLFDAHSLR